MFDEIVTIARDASQGGTAPLQETTAAKILERLHAANARMVPDAAAKDSDTVVRNTYETLQALLLEYPWTDAGLKALDAGLKPLRTAPSQMPTLVGESRETKMDPGHCRPLRFRLQSQGGLQVFPEVAWVDIEVSDSSIVAAPPRVPVTWDLITKARVAQDAESGPFEATDNDGWIVAQALRPGQATITAIYRGQRLKVATVTVAQQVVGFSVQPVSADTRLEELTLENGLDPRDFSALPLEQNPSPGADLNSWTFPLIPRGDQLNSEPRSAWEIVLAGEAHAEDLEGHVFELDSSRIEVMDPPRRFLRLKPGQTRGRFYMRMLGFGQTQITVSYRGVTRTVDVEVQPATLQFKAVAPHALQLDVGEQVELSVIINGPASEPVNVTVRGDGVSGPKKVTIPVGKDRVTHSVTLTKAGPQRIMYYVAQTGEGRSVWINSEPETHWVKLGVRALPQIDADAPGFYQKWA